MSRIAIVGIGGTGSFAAQFLSKTSHELTLIDGDVIEESNLSRQTLFNKNDVFKPKAQTAKQKLGSKNITAIDAHLTTENTNSLLKNADVVLDCTDNWLARMTINQYCLEKNIKWVYSGAIGTQAMVSTIERQPCFACFAEERETISCTQENTIPQATAAAASIATIEALNILEGKPQLLGKLFYLDVKNQISAIKKLNPKENCAYCVQAKKLEKKYSTLCGGKDFVFYNKQTTQKEQVKKIRHKNAELLIFKDGRVLIKNVSFEKAVEANEWLKRKMAE